VDEGYDSQIYGITRKTSQERWDGIFKLLHYTKSKNSKAKISISFRPIRPPNQITNNKKFKSLRLFPNVTTSFLMCYDNWGGKIVQEDLSGIMMLKKGLKKKGICASLYQAVVMPDGHVRLCNCRIKDRENDDLVVGDISVSTLSEILNSSKVTKIREDFIKGMYPEVCVDCTLFRQAK
jgi:radical SAM protein with 4Fe4S-binding SPASM domain